LALNGGVSKPLFACLCTYAVQIFATDFLFSSSCLRFSDAQKKAILNWAKELKAPVVLSFYSIKRSQKHIRDLLGNATEKVTSASGNIFYLNAVGKAIAMVRMPRYVSELY
jgi:hypothetical protein